jgi:hypothetical protein
MGSIDLWIMEIFVCADNVRPLCFGEVTDPYFGGFQRRWQQCDDAFSSATASCIAESTGVHRAEPATCVPNHKLTRSWTRRPGVRSGLWGKGEQTCGNDDDYSAGGPIAGGRLATAALVLEFVLTACDDTRTS